MSTKQLKPANKFIGAASRLLSQGGTKEEVTDLAKEFDISIERVNEYLENKKMSVAVSGAIIAGKDEKEFLYNILDQKFIDQYSNIVIFSRGEHIQFYEYIGGVYVLLYDKQIHNYVDSIMAQYSLFEHRTVIRKVKDTVTRISSLLARTDKRNFSEKDISNRRWFLNLKNGLLDMKSFTLSPHTPDYFSTVQVPFDYDPDTKCPTFDKFIKTVSDSSDSTSQMIQEMYGYCVMEGNPKHKVFYLYGDTARNGKSTTAKILCGLIGWGNVSTLSLSQIGGENTSILTSLVGKQLNFSDEISSKYIESSNLTTMAAEGVVSVNPKYEHSYLYKVTSKFLVACNDLPRFQDSQGMKHRMISIPFNYQIPEGDRIERYDEILLEKEGAGILNWAIEGAKLVLKNNTFSTNEQSKEDMNENSLQSNSVYAFLESEYNFDPSFTQELYNDDLYGNEHNFNEKGTEYRLYCARTGIRPVSGPIFSKELKRFEREHKKIIQKKDTKGYRYYVGLRRKLETRGDFVDFEIIGDQLTRK